MAISKLILSALLVTTTYAHADDTATAEALQKTQMLLQDKTQRDAYGKESPKAATSMKSAEDFVGKENTDELYSISSEVMGTLTTQNHGDITKMQEAIAKRPEDVVKFFTPEEMKRIEELAKKIEAQRNPSAVKPN